jgi:hypothetical protein
MLRIDLEAAGIPYIVQGPDGPLHADFHSLRHSFVALLDRAGASLKQAMQLARHSDPKLTMKRYGRAHLHELAGVVGQLPEFIGTAPATVTVKQVTTGEAAESKGFCRVLAATKTMRRHDSAVTQHEPTSNNSTESAACDFPGNNHELSVTEPARADMTQISPTGVEHPRKTRGKRGLAGKRCRIRCTFGRFWADRL